MNPLRSFARVALAALVIVAAVPARAASDYTDLWWTPSESGWGINLAQQGTLIYATFYLYGQDGRPTWYSALLTRVGTTERFTGPLLRYSGTWFGAPVWSAPTNAQVGTATFAASSTTAATLSYTVDGLAVEKQIERTVLQAIGIDGVYIGGVSGRRSGCSGPGAIIDPMQFDVVHSTQTGSIRIDHLSATTGALICRMQGTAVQIGKLLTVDNADYDCTGGWSSVARIYNLRPTPAGFEGQYFADAGGGCTESGQFSGVTQFP